MRVRGVVGRNLTAPTGSSILSNILGQVCNSGQFLGCGERNIFNPEWHTLHSNSWIRNDLWNICLGRVWIKRKTMNQLNYNNPGSDLLYFLSPVFNFSTCKNTLMPGYQQRVGGGVVYLNIRISSICTISHDQIRMSLTSWFDDNLKRRLIRLQNRDLRNIKRWCILPISPIHTRVRGKYRILKEVETVQHSGESDKHIFPTDVPSHAKASSWSPAEMALQNVLDMFIHKSFGVESLCIWILCFILGDVPTITREDCSSFKSISHILIILTTS